MNRSIGKRLKWVLLGISLPFFLLLSCGLYVVAGCAHRSDRAMERHFVRHQADFEKLVRLFQQDGTLSQGPYLNSAFPSNMSKGRRERYEVLYRRLGVMKIEREGGVILIRASTAHIFDRKGYAWCDQPVESFTCDGVTYRSLASAGELVSGETTRELRHQFRVFRPIAPRWYIYYQGTS
ncbi:MAG TPA: hypothetical protein VFQ05_16980 [Candidatus Eisenbacteria bacterium]|nr:hypothetical protein [Candidatus Eisenbacteria bacterium]